MLSPNVQIDKLLLSVSLAHFALRLLTGLFSSKAAFSFSAEVAISNNNLAGMRKTAHRHPC